MEEIGRTIFLRASGGEERGSFIIVADLWSRGREGGSGAPPVAARRRGCRWVGVEGVRGKGIVFPAVFCFALLGVANQSKLSLFYNSVLGGDLLSPAFQLVGEGVSIRFIPFTRSDVWEKNKGSTDQVGHILFNNITPGGDGRE